MKKRSAKDRLYHSERQLKEYSNFSAQKRLDTFLTVLHPAISRLYSVLSNIPNQEYDKFENLSRDYLLVDVRMIAFLQPNNRICYMKYEEVKKLTYPVGEYKLVDYLTGKCETLDGIEFICERLAIDYYLEAISNKWLKEIPNILKIVSCLE